MTAPDLRRRVYDAARQPVRIDRLFVCCRNRKHYAAWCREQGVPEQGEHVLWVNDLTVLTGHSGMDYHALMASPDWQELAAGCYAQGGRWALGSEIRLWSERVRGVEHQQNDALAARIRRLLADHEDARKALGRAQARFDEIGNRLAALRTEDPVAYAAARRETAS